MAVDAAGQHVEAARVDFVVAGREILGQRDDPAVAHADVAAHRVGRGGDGAAADDEIELGHRRPPVPAAPATRRRLIFAATLDDYSPTRRREASDFRRRAGTAALFHRRSLILGIRLDVGLRRQPG